MSQDVVSDGLNQIMNAKKARKKEVILKKHSILLRNILDIAKDSGYLDYEVDGTNLIVEIKELNEIRAIKPRFTVSVKNINRYVRRFLPAKDFGMVVLSTNQGLMVHKDAEDNKIGGCLIAYIF